MLPTNQHFYIHGKIAMGDIVQCLCIAMCQLDSQPRVKSLPPILTNHVRLENMKSLSDYNKCITHRGPLWWRTSDINSAKRLKFLIMVTT